MRQFLAIAGLSVLVFAAGYGVRIWVDDHRPLPPPPAPFMGEFAVPRPPPPAQKPFNRAELAAKIEAVRPQMEAYRTRIAAIDAEFERNLASVLTPEQRTRHAENLARRANKAPKPEDTQPLTDEQITGLLQKPLMTMFRNITLQMKADDLNKELKLDSGQQDRVMEFLRRRREEFIALVDSVPPPSLTLMSLAPAAQRLGAPKADPAAAPKP